MRRYERQVVIVGAGPAGLMLARTLAQYGLSTLILERRHCPSDRPRATGVSSRSMELLRAIGLEDRVRSRSEPVQLSIAFGETVTDTDIVSTFAIAPPSVTAETSPSPSAFIPQHRLEEELTKVDARTRELIRGSVIEEIRDSGDFVDVTYSVDGLRNSRAVVRAEVVVGADGSRSLVRQLAGIQRRAWSGAAPAQVTTAFTAALWRHIPHARRHSLYVLLKPDGGPSMSIWPVGGDEWVLAQPEGDETTDPLYERIRENCGVPDIPISHKRLGRFEMDCHVAENFVKGRICLIGDAAHAVAPRGGTGLNSAIQDAFNLGWRLGWALSGWVPLSTMLREFEDERRPLAERDAGLASLPIGLMRDMHEELAIERGGRIAHTWLNRSKTLSTLDLVGIGHTVFGMTAPASANVGPIPTKHVALTPEVGRRLGLSPGDWAGVRPDGVIVQSAIA